MTAPTAQRPVPASNAPCPCGSGRIFGQCCEPVLKQQRIPASAEELMRSRFTAHSVRDYRHLHRTYLPTANQPYTEENEAGDFAWTRLVIHSHEAGANADTAFVDFSAYYEESGTEQALHEKSLFQRVDGAWFFSRAVRSGPAPIKSTQAKVGRNEPCPCGSGKKFKHCCGR